MKLIKATTGTIVGPLHVAMSKTYTIQLAIKGPDITKWESVKTKKQPDLWHKINEIKTATNESHWITGTDTL